MRVISESEAVERGTSMLSLDNKDLHSLRMKEREGEKERDEGGGYLECFIKSQSLR